MADFTYDSDDVGAVRAAYADLRSSKQNAFWISTLLLGGLLGREIMIHPDVAFRKRVSFKNFTIFMLASGST